MTEATTEFGPKKTVLILAIVAGCFALLWPKIFYPMLTASVTPPHPVDTSGCCDVIFESDVTAVDIMQELCQNIIKHHQVDPRVRDALAASKFNKLSPSSSSLCREEVLARCGIDLSSFLAAKERLKKTYKQVLEEIRGFNGSLCLKMKFGVPLSRLGTPHLIRYHILMPHSPVRQERQTPPHAGSYHPALRERGRAIPSSHIVPRIHDRPDHMAPMKMRPPMGGAGHVVAAPKGNGSLGLLMPLYTIGIVIFFLYTISKVLVGIVMPLYTVGNILSFLYKVFQVLRKTADSEIMRPDYSTTAAEREYQKLVFNPEIFAAAVTAVNGMPSERHEKPAAAREEPAPTLEELKDLDQASKSYGLATGLSPDFKESNPVPETSNQNEEELGEYQEATPIVKVVNMEMTASCEGGQKCSRPSTPILLTPQTHIEEKEKSPPISIYLEGALPPQCELLVTDSKTQEIQEETNVQVPVVLSGKMTLSLISLDQVAAENDQLDTEGINRGETLSANEDESEFQIDATSTFQLKNDNKILKEIQEKEFSKNKLFLENNKNNDRADQIVIDSKQNINQVRHNEGNLLEGNEESYNEESVKQQKEYEGENEDEDESEEEEDGDDEEEDDDVDVDGNEEDVEDGNEEDVEDGNEEDVEDGDEEEDVEDGDEKEDVVYREGVIEQNKDKQNIDEMEGENEQDEVERDEELDDDEQEEDEQDEDEEVEEDDELSDNDEEEEDINVEVNRVINLQNWKTEMEEDSEEDELENEETDEDTEDEESNRIINIKEPIVVKNRN